MLAFKKKERKRNNKENADITKLLHLAHHPETLSKILVAYS